MAEKNTSKTAALNFGESSDLLHRWWRHILILCKITDLQKYSQLVSQWINNPIYGIPKDPKRQSTYRGNLNKEHFRGTMTWKVWLKALSVIGVDKIEFSVRLHRSQHKENPIVDATFTIDNLPEYIANLISEEPEINGTSKGYQRQSAYKRQVVQLKPTTTPYTQATNSFYDNSTSEIKPSQVNFNVSTSESPKES